jgi:hypothetical protein
LQVLIANLGEENAFLVHVTDHLVDRGWILREHCEIELRNVWSACLLTSRTAMRETLTLAVKTTRDRPAIATMKTTCDRRARGPPELLAAARA